MKKEGKKVEGLMDNTSIQSLKGITSRATSRSLV